jgi:hypothetical protein
VTFELDPEGGDRRQEMVMLIMGLVESERPENNVKCVYEASR